MHRPTDPPEGRRPALRAAHAARGADSPRSRSRVAIALATLGGLALAATGHAEHGDPYEVVIPSPHEGIAPDGALVVASHNGPSGLVHRRCEFVYDTGQARIPARRVERADGVDAEGYGSSHLRLRAARRLPLDAQVSLEVRCVGDEPYVFTPVFRDGVRHRVIETPRAAPQLLSVDVVRPEDSHAPVAVTVRLACVGPCGVELRGHGADAEVIDLVPGRGPWPGELVPETVLLDGAPAAITLTARSLFGPRGASHTLRLVRAHELMTLDVIDVNELAWLTLPADREDLRACVAAAGEDDPVLEPVRRLLVAGSTSRGAAPPLTMREFADFAATMAGTAEAPPRRVRLGRRARDAAGRVVWARADGDGDCPTSRRVAARYDAAGRLVDARTVVETCELVDPSFTETTVRYGPDGRSFDVSLASLVHPAHDDADGNPPLADDLGLVRPLRLPPRPEANCRVALEDRGVSIVCARAEADTVEDRRTLHCPSTPP